MTRKKVTKEEKQLRREWVIKKIDQGVGISELASLVSETWGVYAPKRPSFRVSRPQRVDGDYFWC